MKRLFIILLVLTVGLQTQAVLKERDLDQTLEILRLELTEHHHDLTSMKDGRKQRNKAIINQLIETMRRSDQNSLMLYSQKQEYVFDMTYACHQATEQYYEFKRSQTPFKRFLAKTNLEIAKYDSLHNSLTAMPDKVLSKRARVKRKACLELVENIRKILIENRQQITDYIHYYELTENRLKSLNDYANQRYNDIQTSIFKNGGRNYFATLANLKNNLEGVAETVTGKYAAPPENSQWASSVIFGLFGVIAVYIIIATILNLLAYKFLLPQRFRQEENLHHPGHDNADLCPHYGHSAHNMATELLYYGQRLADRICMVVGGYPDFLAVACQRFTDQKCLSHLRPPHCRRFHRHRVPHHSDSPRAG